MLSDTIDSLKLAQSDFAPSAVAPGRIIYVSQRYPLAIHLWMSGCGLQVPTKPGPANGALVSKNGRFQETETGCSFKNLVVSEFLKPWYI